MSGCGRLTQGTDSKDDFLPCGTKLYWGTERGKKSEGVLLCTKCKNTKE